MAIKPLAELDDFDLVNSDQDCRGWTVVDPSGKPLGTVSDMLVDTDRESVVMLKLDSGATAMTRDVSLKDGTVVMRDTQAQGAKAAPTATGARSEGEVMLPVIEEQIKIGKRAVESGGVRVHSRVTEKPVEETVTLREEEVNVERRPANREVSQADMAAMRGGTIEVTEMAEQAVVAKQARVVGEVVISKDVTEREETVRDTVRRTDVEVEQLDADTTARGKAGGK